MTDIQSTLWVVVPASGVGTRMQSATPKQYLSICDKTVMEHTLDKLSQVENVKGIVVVVSQNDSFIQSINLTSYKNVHIAFGGDTRAQSVLNGLDYIQRFENQNEQILQNTSSSKNNAPAQPWVLVHDCARPCVSVDDIHRLVKTCMKNNAGGILATKISDTVKLANTQNSVYDAATIQSTQDRTYLWRAQTPQFFKLVDLICAIQQAQSQNILLTDEASAMENAKQTVLMIESDQSNIKITTQSDLPLAEFYLKTKLLS